MRVKVKLRVGVEVVDGVRVKVSLLTHTFQDVGAAWVGMRVDEGWG